MYSKYLIQIILVIVVVALFLKGIDNLITGKNTFRKQFGQKIIDILTIKESFGVSPGTIIAMPGDNTAWREPFGVSPGTLTQLAANHVPTAEDIPMLKQWMKERQEGVWQMTESDLVGKAPIEYSILGSRIGAFA